MGIPRKTGPSGLSWPTGSRSGERSMGIRFLCPNGHKLNVKQFQAGQRGICPFCGVKIIVPAESTPPNCAGKAGRSSCRNLFGHRPKRRSGRHFGR